MGIIYLYTNKSDEKVYVGQTRHTLDRRRRNGYASNPHFCRAVGRDGWDGFDAQVIGDAPTQEKLNNLEKLWIILLRARNPEFGYNLKEGGSNGQHSPETLAKMSAAHKGQPGWNKGISPSVETRAKIARALTGHKLSNEHRAKIADAGRGHKHSDASRAKMSATKKGCKPSDDVRAKLSAAHMGHKHSDEQRAKISAALTGRKLSEDHRTNLSIARKGHKFSPEHKTKLSEAWIRRRLRSRQ